MEVASELISLRTLDGDCRTHVLTPDAGAPRASIIMYMDGFGIRPTFVGMAQRLADLGYVVLLPDMYYRYGHYDPIDPMESYARGDRTMIAPLRATIDNPKAARDTRAMLDYLGQRADAKGKPVGLVGFCMGGGFALAAAGTYPEEIQAVATFHGGHLATDEPTSPHLLAPQMKAAVYIGGAENDSSYPPAMAERLEKALSEAGVDSVCEIYPGTAHSWMVSDIPAYNEPQAERGWETMATFFADKLG